MESDAERNRTRSTGKSPGIAGFFKDKINDFKGFFIDDAGVDPEKARQSRLDKLKDRIEEVSVFLSSQLEESVKSSEETSVQFSNKVVSEFEFFEDCKLMDFKDLFEKLTTAQLEFHENGVEFWDNLIPTLDAIKLEADETIDNI